MRRTIWYIGRYLYAQKNITELLLISILSYLGWELSPSLRDSRYTQIVRESHTIGHIIYNRDSFSPLFYV